MANKDKLYNKRYKTLKEHRAAVKARKLLEGGKNKGPVANADAYGSTIKKPAAKKPSKAPTSASKPSKPAAKPTPTKSNKERAASRFYSSSSKGSVQKNQDKAKSNFFRSSSGTRGENMPSNPKLKSQKKRVSYTGQGGRKKFKTVDIKPPKAKKKTNRRGRRVR